MTAREASGAYVQPSSSRRVYRRPVDYVKVWALA